MERKQKGGRQRAAGHTDANDLEKELARLATSDLDQLRREWRLKFNGPAPSVRSRDTLLRILGWQIQATTLGGIDADTEGKLRRIASALEADGDYEPKIRRDVSPGVILTREWRGVVHKVTVTAGGFQHLGKQYGSLSDIARTIAGTRWSGPRFFGLEQKKQPKRHGRAAVTGAAAGDAP